MLSAKVYRPRPGDGLFAGRQLDKWHAEGLVNHMMARVLFMVLARAGVLRLDFGLKRIARLVALLDEPPARFARDAVGWAKFKALLPPFEDKNDGRLTPDDWDSCVVRLMQLEPDDLNLLKKYAAVTQEFEADPNAETRRTKRICASRLWTSQYLVTAKGQKLAEEASAWPSAVFTDAAAARTLRDDQYCADLDGHECYLRDDLEAYERPAPIPSVETFERAASETLRDIRAVAVPGFHHRGLCVSFGPFVDRVPPHKLAMVEAVALALVEANVSKMASRLTTVDAVRQLVDDTREAFLWSPMLHPVALWYAPRDTSGCAPHDINFPDLALVIHDGALDQCLFWAMVYRNERAGSSSVCGIMKSCILIMTHEHTNAEELLWSTVASLDNPGKIHMSDNRFPLAPRRQIFMDMKRWNRASVDFSSGLVDPTKLKDFVATKLQHTIVLELCT